MLAQAAAPVRILSDSEIRAVLAERVDKFTSLLLADMAGRGEVALDDPVARYLPPGVRVPERKDARSPWWIWQPICPDCRAKPRTSSRICRIGRPATRRPPCMNDVDRQLKHLPIAVEIERAAVRIGGGDSTASFTSAFGARWLSAPAR